MTRILILLAFIVSALIIVAVPVFVSQDYVGTYGPVTILDTSQAILLCAIGAFVVGVLAYKSELQGPFLLQIFLAALLIRMIVGSSIFIFHYQTFFGGDAFTYDWLGYEQMRAWGGSQYSQSVIRAFFMKAGAPWGMVYLVGAIYQLVGRNMLAVQFVNSIL